MVLLYTGYLFLPKKGRSHDERLVNIKARLGANVFDSMFPVRTEVVIPEAILFDINDMLKLGFQSHPLSRSDDALEDAVLDSLAVIQAGLRNLPQAPLPACSNNGDIVAHENQHVITSKKRVDSRRCRRG
jgi:hypothetical protein